MSKFANYVAKWNGSSWSALRTGTNGSVYTLAVDGNGNVFAGGSFTTAGGVSAGNIAKWDGTQWSALGTGMDGKVTALVIDGNGRLYAGGQFAVAGGVSVSRIAVWDGATWSTIGSGVDGDVAALAIDNGSKLYVGGSFTTAGGASAANIAKWNGSQWSALGSGVGNWVNALTVDCDGNVYAGGAFTTAGGVSANYVAKWDGLSWSAMGSGVDSDVCTLVIDGSGKVYAGGGFYRAGGVVVAGIAQWDGLSWSPLAGDGPGEVVCSLAFDGTGNLYVGGDLKGVGIAKWDGDSWSALVSGSGVDSVIYGLAPDGSGGVYAGGALRVAGGVGVNNIARWDGASWHALGSGIGHGVYALAVGGNSNLFAAYTSAGEQIAKWDGTVWSVFGVADAHVNNLTVDGAGNVYAIGTFGIIYPGPGSPGVAKWDGVSWTRVGGAELNFPHKTMVADRNGHVYVAGCFYLPELGCSGYYVANWDGTSYSPLGLEMDGRVDVMAVDAEGNLYVGGTFSTIGGVSAKKVAKWDGTQWSALGSGINETVWAFAADGNGNLYVGGSFSTAGGVSASNIAKWDGTQWSALGSGTNGAVMALAIDGGGGVYLGGHFTAAGGKVSSHSAKWANTPPANTAPPVVTGTFFIGQQLGSSAGSWMDGEGDAIAISYQWLRADDADGTNEEPISSATASTYTLTPSDEFRYVCAKVTADDGYGGKTSIQTAYVVCPGPLNNFLVEAYSGGDVGAQMYAVPFNIRITARDSAGNTITTFTDTADLTSTGVLAGAPVVTASFVNGTLSSQSVTINSVQNDTTISATLTGGGPSGTSNAFVVQKANATVTLGDLTATYDGTPKAASATTVPPELTIAFAYDGSGTAPSSAGSYVVIGTIDDEHYQGSAAGTLIISPTVLTVTPTNKAKVYGEEFAGFSGTITGIQNGDNITASYASDGAAATATVADYDITATLNDPDGKLANYTFTLNTGTLSVGKTALTVTPDDKSKVYGDVFAAFTGTIAGIQNNDNITASYASDGAAVTATVADYDITATLNDPDGRLGNYTVTLNTGTLSVGKATPTLNWSNPADITYGTPLSRTQLNARANVMGQYSYTPAAGTVLNAGSQTLRVDFTPGDSANYNSTSATVAINVLKATPAITWANPASIAYGTPLSGTQLNATANTAGTFSYAPAAGTVLNAGNGQTLHVDFDPDDTANYTSTSATATINVVKATPKITWANPADIIYGNALSAAQLNATADVAGTFSYSPAAGAVLNPGDGQTLSVSFAPGDTANYASASATATINVKPAVAPAITGALTASATQGSAFSYTITASGSTPMTFDAESLPSGLSFSGNTISGTPTVGGVASIALKATNAAGSDTKTLQLTITKPAGTPNNPPTVSSPPTANMPTGATGQPVTFTVAATDSDGDILGYTWDFGDGTTGTGASASHVYTTPGIYTVTVTISDGTTTTQQQMDFVVSAGEAPVGDDNGGDDTWGTSGLDAFSITKVSLKFNFASGSKDALQLSGTLPVAKFFKPASKKVTVLIGGFKKDFPLNAKGQGTAGASKFQMKGKMKKGVFKATPAKFTLSIKGEPLLAALAEFDFANETTAKSGEPHDISVIIMVDTLGYETEKSVLYKATAGKSGSGKTLK